MCLSLDMLRLHCLLLETPVSYLPYQLLLSVHALPIVREYCKTRFRTYQLLTL